MTMGSGIEDIGHRPGRAARNNIISFLERHRTWRPGKTAFLRPEFAPGLDEASAFLHHREMSFSALGAAVESAAAGLAKLGLRRADRVFIFLPMSPELYIAMFAVQRLGAIAVFLDSWARRDQLALCAGQVEPRCFIGLEAAFSLTRGLPDLERIPIRVVSGRGAGGYTAALEDLAAGGGNAPLEEVDAEETALVTFTTGSSGPPKGADRTHRFLAAQHRAIDRVLPYEEGDVDLPVFPVFALNNLASGVTTILPAVDLARPASTDGATLVRQMREAGATCCMLSPSLLRAVAEAGKRAPEALARLRRIATGGAPVTTQDAASLKEAARAAELHILYGSTEVEPIAHLVAGEEPTPGEGEGVCVGRIVAGLDWKFIGIQRRSVELGVGGWEEIEVPAGEPGELVVRGDHVCRGYFRNEDAFRRAKIRDGEGRIWHRTGDVGRLDARGRLRLLGRVHNAIRRQGRLLFPVGPETVMKLLPFVKDAAYIGLPDGEGSEKAVAVFTTRENSEEPDAEKKVAQVLAAEGIVCDEVVRIDAIPLDPRHHSKVEYTLLRRQLLDRGAGGAP